MTAAYILGALSLAFLTFAAMRFAGSAAHPQARTWLIIGVVFGAVSAWLIYAG